MRTRRRRMKRGEEGKDEEIREGERGSGTRRRVNRKEEGKDHWGRGREETRRMKG